MESHSSQSRTKPQNFTARRYADAVYAVVVCPSVCLSVTEMKRVKKTSLCLLFWGFIVRTRCVSPFVYV